MYELVKVALSVGCLALPGELLKVYPHTNTQGYEVRCRLTSVLSGRSTP